MYIWDLNADLLELHFLSGICDIGKLNILMISQGQIQLSPVSCASLEHSSLGVGGLADGGMNPASGSDAVGH